MSWLAFTTWVGAENLLHRPAHESGALLKNAFRVAWFNLQSVSIAMAAMLAVIHLRRKHCAREAVFIAVASISTFWLCFFILRLMVHDAHCSSSSPFLLYLIGLQFCHPSQIGVLGHALLLTSLVGLFFVKKLRLISSLAGAGLKKLRSRALWRSICVALFWIDVTTPSGATLLVGAIVSLAAAVSAIGSNSHHGVSMSFSAGLAMGISLVAACHIATKSWQKHWVAGNAILAVTCGLVFTLSYNHSSGKPVFAYSDVIVDNGPLRGNYFRPAEVQFLEAVAKAFEAHDCRSAEFIVLDYMPLIYYFAGKIRRDRLIRVVRPAFYYPTDAIMLNLKQTKSWCVLEFSTSETENSRRSGQQEARKLIGAYVSKNSEKMILLPSPGADIIGEPKLWVNMPHSSAGPIGKP